MDYGTVVTLTATTDAGSIFSGWSGACSNGTGDCVVTMDAAKFVTATFTLEQYSLALATDGNGSGSVIAAPDLSLYDYGAIVTLTANADPGSYFDGWAGDLNGSTNPITITIMANTAITATFTLEQYVLSVSLGGTGGGNVTSIPTGIDCGTDCTETFDYGTVVTLTATADSISAFTGWSGAGCNGTGTCVVTMDEAQNVTAIFTRDKYPIFLPIILKP